MTQRDQIRAMTLDRVLEGALTGTEAAEQLGRSVRQPRRRLAAYRAEGVAANPHGNRGRPSPRAVAPAARERVVALSRTTTTYAGTNDSHLRDLLAEREGIALSRSTVRRMRRAAGEASPRPRRAPQHRQRRERRPQEGMLLHLDGSPHAWLEDRGPRLTLLAAIDDAPGTIAGAVWRAQEDSAGYLSTPSEVSRRIAGKGGPAMPKIIRLALPPDQRRELDRRLRARTTERRAYERLAMIRAVGDGATIPQAARALGVHEQTVRKFVARFAAEGFAGLADRPRAGRPPRLMAADLAAVEARLDADARTGARTWTLPQLAAWLAEERGVTVTSDHLGTRLKRRDFRWKRTKRTTTHKQRDPDRQEEAAADLALLPFCRGSPTWG